MQDKGENLFWIDYIRAIAVLGVVFIHVAADVITQWSAISPNKWWAANIYDSLTRGCVPTFIMISGALLLPVQESFRDFFRKRFNRIFIPFLVWTILYLVWKKAFYNPDLGVLQSLGMVSNSGVWFHLWFFYILIGLYLLTPIFRIFIAHATFKGVGYFLTIWFAFGSFFPFLDNIARVLGLPGFHIGLSVEAAQGFIGYFILGAFLIKYANKEWTRWAGLIWASCFLICFLGTGWLTIRSGNFQKTFYDNFAPNIVFYCASFFVLVKFRLTSIESRISSSMKNFIVNLSKASFGVYLIHPMIIDILDKGRLGLVLKPTDGHPLIMIPGLSIVIYFVSFFIVRIIQKIPYLKRIV
jgi:surface polysaccharide O-acyltransferase-like enzyme